MITLRCSKDIAQKICIIDIRQAVTNPRSFIQVEAGEDRWPWPLDPQLAHVYK